MERLKEWYLKYPSSLLGVLLFFVILIVGRAVLLYPTALETEIRSIEQRGREYTEELEAIDVQQAETSQYRAITAFDDYKEKMDWAIKGYVEEAFGGVVDQASYDTLHQKITDAWDSDLADTILNMVQRQDGTGGVIYPYLSNNGVTMAIGQINPKNNSIPLLFETIVDVTWYVEDDIHTSEDRLNLESESRQLLLMGYYNIDDEGIYDLRIQMDEGMGDFMGKYGIERDLDGYHVRPIRPESGYEIQRGHELKLLPEERRKAPAIEPREDAYNRDDME